MNYLEQVIYQMPGLFWVADERGRYLSMNQCCVDWAGFSKLENAIGADYTAINCRAVELIAEWINQDVNVFQSKVPQKYLSYACYAKNRWRLIVGEKRLFCPSSGTLNQVICHFTEITNLSVADIFPFLKNSSGFAQQRQFSVNLLDRYPLAGTGYLNTTESECLFFLLRGKTFRQIAALLGLTFKRVEQYVYALKVKFNCFSKGELIEKAINQGYLNFIPETLFRSPAQFREVVQYE